METILIIDDDPIARESIKEVVEMSGYLTLTAHDGKDGVEKALAHLPDLIVCDVEMPVLDGFGVVQQIRKSEQAFNIPFIFLTSRTERETQRSGMDLGADDFLTKPVSLKQLVRVLEGRLKRQNQAKYQVQNRIDNLVRQMNMTARHEFNTPLNGILGLSQLIVDMRDSLGKDKIVDLVRVIQDSAHRLKGTVDNLIIYQSIVGNNKDAQWTNNGVAKIFGQLVESSLQSKLLKFNRAEDLELDIEEALIVASERQLPKILQEIVDNAFKFSRRGSKVKIKGRRVAEGYLLTIQDQGVGLSAEETRQMGPFVQFRRMELAQQGSGLGFFIASRLVEFCGAQMHLRSELGQGTSVSILFALASE